MPHNFHSTLATASLPLVFWASSAFAAPSHIEIKRDQTQSAIELQGQYEPPGKKLVLALEVRHAQASGAIDYLGVPGPIEFDGQSYELAWSSNPAPTYVKHEYVPEGQNVETYSQMLLIETVTGDITVMNALASQVEMLNQRRDSDPLLNMDVIQNEASGEALLDFIVSSKDARGEYIVEWNAYRYAPYKTASGQTGVLLFAISHRAYGNDNAKAFLGNLKDNRSAQIKALVGSKLPIISGPSR